jgi:hypothetical protein
MTTWPSRPDRDQHTNTTPLHRSKPGRTITALIASADLVGAYTHFWKGRTSICTYPACEPCSTSRSARWYGFLHIWSPETNASGILELTPSCLPAVDDWLEKFGTLRGAKICVSRASHKINSRVIATLKASPYALEKIPPALDLIAQLSRMWEVTRDTAADADDDAQKVRANLKQLRTVG